MALFRLYCWSALAVTLSCCCALSSPVGAVPAAFAVPACCWEEGGGRRITRSRRVTDCEEDFGSSRSSPPSRRRSTRASQPSVVSPAIEKLQSLTDGKDRSGTFAIVQIGGNQKRVEKGRWYECLRINNAPVGSKIWLTRVLFYQDDVDSFIGQPFLEHIYVVATVLSHYSGPMVPVIKFKPKKHYRKSKEYYPSLSKFKVDGIYRLSQQITSHPDWAGYLTDPLYKLLRDTTYPGGLSPLMGSFRKEALRWRTPFSARQASSDSTGDKANKRDPLANFELADARQLQQALGRI
eukprot:GHVU01137258.1.p1 GENE.GHVU01137258.1~~GHVU01137258.1.p1  ORF type:complete len:294 (+),score=19.56 GHVU01137258.1:63-944(+)